MKGEAENNVLVFAQDPLQDLHPTQGEISKKEPNLDIVNLEKYISLGFGRLYKRSSLHL